MLEQFLNSNIHNYNVPRCQKVTSKDSKKKKKNAFHGQKR